VVQKVYGGEKPVPLWLEDSDEPTSSSLKRVLFSLVIRIKVCCYQNMSDFAIKVILIPGF